MSIYDATHITITLDNKLINAKGFVRSVEIDQEPVLCGLQRMRETFEAIAATFDSLIPHRRWWNRIADGMFAARENLQRSVEGRNTKRGEQPIVRYYHDAKTW